MVGQAVSLTSSAFAFLYSQLYGFYTCGSVKLGPRQRVLNCSYDGVGTHSLFVIWGEASGLVCSVKNCFYSLNKEGLSGTRSGGGVLLLAGWLVPPMRTAVGDAPLCLDPRHRAMLQSSQEGPGGSSLCLVVSARLCPVSQLGAASRLQTEAAELQVTVWGRDPAPRVLPKVTQLLAATPGLGHIGPGAGQCHSKALACVLPSAQQRPAEG